MLGRFQWACQGKQREKYGKLETRFPTNILLGAYFMILKQMQCHTRFSSVLSEHILSVTRAAVAQDLVGAEEIKQRKY